MSSATTVDKDINSKNKRQQEKLELKEEEGVVTAAVEAVVVEEKPSSSSQEESTVQQQEPHKDRPACADPNISTQGMLKEMWTVGFPSMAFLLANFATQTITMSFVGHRLGFTALGQFSVGLSVFNILAAAIGIGFTGALDTLAPQAFGRDSTTNELSEMFQRASVVNFLMMIPLSFVLWNLEPALVAIYPPALAVGAAEFLRAAPVYTFLLWESNVLFRLFTAHHLANVPLLSNGISAATALAINYYYLPEGSTLTDCMINLTIIQTVCCAVLVACAHLHPQSVLKGLFKDFSLARCFDKEKMEEYAGIGIYAMLGICSEWWGFEGMAVVVAQIGELEVAAFTILLNTLLLYFCIPCGNSMGGSTMLGNCLGAMEPELGKKYVMLSFKTVAVTTFLSGCSLIFFGMDIMRLYTLDEKVLATVKPLMVLMATWHAMDAAQTSIQNLFRGAGMQDLSSKIALFSLWGIGLPCCYLFGVHFQFGLVGIIGGQCCGLCVMIPLLIHNILKFDYHGLALKAQQEQQKEEEKGGEEKGGEEGKEGEDLSEGQGQTAKAEQQALTLKEAKEEGSAAEVDGDNKRTVVDDSGSSSTN